jgi:thymidylate synthase
VSGWVDKSAIAKKLDSNQYAVIGQLYSSISGINLLIRNLLYNPHVRYLVILNATKQDENSGAVRCLREFFRKGFQLGKSDIGKECWVINSAVPGYIDKEIPAEALEKLRESIDCQEAISILEAVKLIQSFSELPIEPWGEPVTFPLIETIPTVLPGQRYGHRLEGKTIAETWVKIIHRIKTTGVLRPTGYDGQWQELIDLMAVVTDEPADFFFRSRIIYDRQRISGTVYTSDASRCPLQRRH